jgi:hypothetical protein
MNLVQVALRENDLASARERLNRHRHRRQSQISNLKSQIQTDLRGWEWRYLWLMFPPHEAVFPGTRGRPNSLRAASLTWVLEAPDVGFS